MLVVQIITILILIIIFVEDMYNRAVHWYWFPLSAIGLGFLNYGEQPDFVRIANTLLFNTAFVIVLLVLLTVYFSFRHKRFVNLNNGLLGIGDILFWLVAGCYLSLLNFIIFYIISIILILFGWLLYQGFASVSNKRIPLAGLQSFLLAVVLTLSWSKWIPRLQTDDYLIKLLLPWS